MWITQAPAAQADRATLAAPAALTALAAWGALSAPSTSVQAAQLTTTSGRVWRTASSTAWPSAMSSSAWVSATSSNSPAAASTRSCPSIPPAPAMRSRVDVNGLVGPEVLDHLPVAALRPVVADRDQDQAIGTAFERAHDLRRHAQHIAVVQFDDLIV